MEIKDCINVTLKKNEVIKKDNAYLYNAERKGNCKSKKIRRA